MGILGNQPQRNPRLVNEDDARAFLNSVVRLSAEYEISRSEVIAAIHVLELHRIADALKMRAE